MNQASLVPAEIGLPVTHESGRKHVTGAARFIDDIVEEEGTLHAAVGCSPVASGRLMSVDLADVFRSSGVVDVITAKDVPGDVDIGPVFPGDPLLAVQQILFHSQPIFAVVASSYTQARVAASRGKYSIEQTTPLLDPKLALQQGQLVRPSHVMSRGDASAALAAAEHQLKGELTIGGQEHYYLESQVSLARPTEDNGMYVLSSTQNPTEVQHLVARVLQLPLNLVIVETRRMGGAFGGKETHAAPGACLAAVLAQRTGRSVKLRLSRADDMRLTGKRHSFQSEYHVGFDQSGRLSASRMEMLANCGCSPDLSDAIVDRAMFHADNAYHLGNTSVSGHRAFTNTVSNTAFRGFGGPQGMMLIEGVMDDIARHLGKDPLDVRKQNLYGDAPRNVTHYHQTVDSEPLHRLIEELERSAEYRERRKKIELFNANNDVMKKGLALTPVKFGISFTIRHMNQAGALLNVYSDGSAEINHGGTEMGQGLNTKVAQVVAAELGISLSNISVTATRTDKVPNTSPTAASSGSDLNGKAAQKAAERIKKRLVKFLVASEQLDDQPIEFANNEVRYGHTVIGFPELVKRAYMNRISLSATGFYRTPKIHYDRESASGRPFLYYSNGAACSEVTIDTMTGEYRVNRVDVLQDVGNSLNPAIDKGQIEGGFIQGMGWLTTEELSWDEQGKLLTTGASTYKIPAAADTPEIFNVALLDNCPNREKTIHRSKGIGEPPLMLAISVWSALRDAISSLANYEMSPKLDSPATPERVYWAVQDAKKHAQSAAQMAEK